MAKNNFSGELLHFNAVRLRVTGSGNLNSSLNSLDDVNVSDLEVIPMVALTNREPTILANYIDQMGCFRFGTTEIGETFVISKIVIFIKPFATGYPQ